MLASKFLRAGVASTARAVPSASKIASASCASRHFSSTSDEATFDFGTWETHLCDAPPQSITSNKTEMMEYYKKMYTYRRMEIAADVMYKAQQIRGFCHLYDGQEAIGVGMEAALTFDDCIVTTYRDHCTQLGRGDTVHRVLAELAGKATGCTKGKGGSMHLYRKESNFYGGHGIVGSTGPLGAGLAFSIKYKKLPHVAMAMYGDGAANQGQLFEAFNMAQMWKLPVIFVCENNHYAMGTSVARGSQNPDYFKRGDKIAGMRVDGMDVLAVREAVRHAADNYCRVGKGPFVLEMDTYRYHGHSMSDPGVTYRSRDEISGVRKARDPIDRVKKILLDKSWATAEELKAVDKEVRGEIDAAVKRAVADPYPEAGELWNDVFQGADGKSSEKPYHRGVEMTTGFGTYPV